VGKAKRASPWRDHARSPMIQDRGGTENRTALISLGIPKLVRFDKIRPQQLFMVFFYQSGFRSL
jgi:hypothetical protein